MLACDDVRRVVAQSRAHLASPPGAADPRAFAEALIDWIDPHGLWTASPDSPVAGSIRRKSRDLLAEIEAPPGSAPCATSQALGRELSAWVGELRTELFRARRGSPMTGRPEAFRLASLPAFEEGAVTRPARELATELGGRVGTLDRAFGPSMSRVTDASIARALPEGIDWSRVILAAAARAYVPQIDPHGGWAPLDEETSLYEIELEASPPPRLWRRMTRTAVGIRIEETAALHLGPGEVVVEVGDVPTAGLSVELAEQLAYVDSDPAAPAQKRLVVLGPDDEGPREIEVTVGGGETSPGEARTSELGGHLVGYGGGAVLVIAMTDVPDNLGEELIATLARARSEAKLAGVILDLRGNGGGSTDGASNALGVFLPGAALFPLKRRDGSIEVEHAPTPAPADRWTGPVAALVDGDTASAAEMIAGALAAYRRGPVVGQRTYGKGCAQEYLDDDAHAGVLRLTTLVYALPDGSPVQQAGIIPTIKLLLPRATERESMLAHPLASWTGPDVRDARLVKEVMWPGHGGVVGPCGDAVLCKALRALGAPRAAVAKGR
jgi:carboxyl-terminal processing protease